MDDFPVPPVSSGIPSFGRGAETSVAPRPATLALLPPATCLPASTRGLVGAVPRGLARSFSAFHGG